MKLLILGATGKTGSVLLRQALDAGHDVTAIVRSAAGITTQSPNLHVVEGSVLRSQDLEKVVAGQGAVLSTLGARSLKETTIYSEPIRHAVGAMRTQRVKRLLCIASAGLEKRDPAFGFFYRVFLKGMLLRNSYADMTRMEAILDRVTDLEWIVVRPTFLTEGPLTGKYRVSKKLCPPGRRPRISREDVAHFMLQQIAAPDYVHQKPALAY
jgi:putative NADH-flavin reductase